MHVDFVQDCYDARLKEFEEKEAVIQLEDESTKTVDRKKIKIVSIKSNHCMDLEGMML